VSDLFRAMKENHCGVGLEPGPIHGRLDPHIQSQYRPQGATQCSNPTMTHSPKRGPERESLGPSLRVSRPLCLWFGLGLLLPFAIIVPWASDLKSSSQPFLLLRMNC
jgi:hypothetical protein